MASNRFFLREGSSSSEETSDDEQQVQVQAAKKGVGKGAAKQYASLLQKFSFCFH